MENYSNVLLYGAIAAIALLIGGVISIIKKPNAQVRSAILHFAAGVVFSVVSVELLPDIMAKHDTLEIAIGYLIGRDFRGSSGSGFGIRIGSRSIFGYGRILVEAHESRQSPWLTAVFIGGFLLFMMLPGG